MRGDLDFLTAGLHGRRSRFAEGARLDALSRVRNQADLVRARFPEAPFLAAVDFQKCLVQAMVAEVNDLASRLGGPGGALVQWLLARFLVENLKLLIRGIATHTPFDVVRKHLVVLPEPWRVDAEGLAGQQSLKVFIERLPQGELRESAEEALQTYGSKPFFLEAALDGGYLRELLARSRRISGEDKAVIDALIRQEADIFHLVLVARGKFHYGLSAAELLPLHVEGTYISRERMATMLGDPDLPTAASRLLRRAIDSLPAAISEPGETETRSYSAALEALAWNRYRGLANRAFRRSHIGLGTVIGYVALRRIETANLITISEAIRLGTPPDRVRTRMIPRNQLEAAHV